MILRLVITKAKTLGQVEYYNIYTSNDVAFPDELAVNPDILKFIGEGFAKFQKVNHSRWDMEVTTSSIITT